jgi:signal transduction histidine kinase
VVKSHLGKIEVDSKVGKGSTFILDFPLYTS